MRFLASLLALHLSFYFIPVAGALPVAIRDSPASAQDPNDTETEVDGPGGFKVIYKGPEKWFEDNWWMVIGGIGLLGLLALIWRRLDKTKT